MSSTNGTPVSVTLSISRQDRQPRTTYQVWRHKLSGELYLARVAGDHTLSFVGMPFSRAELTDRSQDALDDLWHSQTIGEVVTLPLHAALADFRLSNA